MQIYPSCTLERVWSLCFTPCKFLARYLFGLRGPHGFICFHLLPPFFPGSLFHAWAVQSTVSYSGGNTVTTCIPRPLGGWDRSCLTWNSWVMPIPVPRAMQPPPPKKTLTNKNEQKPPKRNKKPNPKPTSNVAVTHALFLCGAFRAGPSFVVVSLQVVTLVLNSAGSTQDRVQ